MCDIERAIAIEDRLRSLERFVAEYVAHDLIDHAHVHDGYVTTARLREEVDGCLAAAAAELEPAEEEAADEGGTEEEPVEAKEEPATKETKDEKGPGSQGQPERRHALHHRIGGRRS